MMWILGSAVLLLLYRYTLRLATWQQDKWAAEEAVLKSEAWLTRKVSAVRIWLFTQLGLTDRVWRALRARYQAGAFGMEGT